MDEKKNAVKKRIKNKNTIKTSNLDVPLNSCVDVAVLSGLRTGRRTSRPPPRWKQMKHLKTIIFEVMFILKVIWLPKWGAKWKAVKQ